MNVYSDILSMIGHTPMLQLSRLDTGPCQLFLKLEFQNPGGSIKDRIAVAMVEAAEKSGKLKPGGTIIEATAGNTGLGLALIAAVKGYKLILVLPDKMSKEKIAHLKAFGTEVILTRSDVQKGHPEYYQDLAQSITKKTPNCFYINQFANPNNPAAHKATAQEVWQQLDYNVDAVVCGVGSGGTVTGITQFIRDQSLASKIILADPVGSVLADYIETGQLGKAASWKVEGIGEDFLPSICDLSAVSDAYAISDKDSFATARELLRKEGLFVGSSTGTLVCAALRYCRAQTQPQRVVTFAGDNGGKYLSKMFNDQWMLDQGFHPAPHQGDLTDLLNFRYDYKETITLAPKETLATAFIRMKQNALSQLPVMENQQIMGLVTEKTLMNAVQNPSNFNQTADGVMHTNLERIEFNAPLSTLYAILEQGATAVVMQQKKFLGLITPTDYISHQYRRFIQ